MKMSTGSRIKQLRVKKGFTQDHMAHQLGMNRANFSNYERDVASPPGDTLSKIADILGTSTDYLLGRSEEQPIIEPYYALTPKDERDITKKLEQMLGELDSDSGLSFMSGAEMDDEDRELLRISLEQTIRMSKELAKKKFTPKKYRN